MGAVSWVFKWCSSFKTGKWFRVPYRSKAFPRELSLKFETSELWLVDEGNQYFFWDMIGRLYNISQVHTVTSQTSISYKNSMDSLCDSLLAEAWCKNNAMALTWTRWHPHGSIQCGDHQGICICWLEGICQSSLYKQKFNMETVWIRLLVVMFESKITAIGSYLTTCGFYKCLMPDS